MNANQVNANPKSPKQRNLANINHNDARNPAENKTPNLVENGVRNLNKYNTQNPDKNAQDTQNTAQNYNKDTQNTAQTMNLENLKRKRLIFALVGICVLLLDQAIKIALLAQEANPIAQSAFIDIVLVFNKGVAFSLLSSLGGFLKWLLVLLLCLMLVLVLKSGDFFAKYYVPLGAIFGAGFGNLVDRFVHNGVVDYIYWHFGFKFAVFNFADSIINISIAFIVIHGIYSEFKKLKFKKEQQ